jgi:hypothetical protein
VLDVKYFQLHAVSPFIEVLAESLEARPIQISKCVGIHRKPVALSCHEIELSGNSRRIGNQIRGAELLRVWRKRSDKHIAGLGCHDWNAEIKKSLANLRLGVFELVVKLAPADGYLRLNGFKERLRIGRAISSVMREQQDIDFALENLAATKVCANVGILNISQTCNVKAALAKQLDGRVVV